MTLLEVLSKLNSLYAIHGNLPVVHNDISNLEAPEPLRYVEYDPQYGIVIS